ncbi:MAG: response regulator transcription factor [Candidatus Aminicenantes bacterium]|nr:response regulator transcription factor [Candidatus Aminicenantes bacterium]
MIKALVVDDEPMSRKRIATLLRREGDVAVVGEAGNGRDALRLIRDLKPDLVFLDIQMPEMSGLQVLDALPEAAPPQVIFVTAYDQYALKAFELHAVEYLLKPFDDERFRQALNHARQCCGRTSAEERMVLRDLLDSLQRNERVLRHLSVKKGDHFILVNIDEVDWFEAQGVYIRVHVGKESHLLRERMKNLEMRLNPRQFARLHRSAIVRLDFIREFQRWYRGEWLALLKDGTKVPVSRTYYDRFKESL